MSTPTDSERFVERVTALAQSLAEISEEAGIRASIKVNSNKHTTVTVYGPKGGEIARCEGAEMTDWYGSPRQRSCRWNVYPVEWCHVEWCAIETMEEVAEAAAADAATAGGAA